MPMVMLIYNKDAKHRDIIETYHTIFVLQLCTLLTSLTSFLSLPEILFAQGIVDVFLIIFK